MKAHFSFRQLLVATVCLISIPASAHEAPCSYCKRDIVQDTASMDHETAIRYGRKRIEYRCVYCALADAQSASTLSSGDLTLLAPSEKKGLPIPIMRTAGKWSVPSGVVFLGADKPDHAVCASVYRAFTNRAALDNYVKANAKTITAEAKPLTFSELLALTDPKRK